MQSWLANAQQIISQYGGYVSRLLDQGVVALFGASKAYENHARLAVLSALEIFKRPLALVKREKIEVAIAVNSGPVVIIYLKENSGHLYTAPGETTATAKRSQQISDKDTVLISASTLDLVNADVCVTPIDFAEEDSGAFRVTISPGCKAAIRHSWYFHN